LHHPRKTFREIIRPEKDSMMVDPPAIVIVGVLDLVCPWVPRLLAEENAIAIQAYVREQAIGILVPAVSLWFTGILEDLVESEGVRSALRHDERHELRILTPVVCSERYQLILRSIV